MAPMIDTPARDELDEFVRAFEVEYQRRGEADPGDFLPPTDHPLYAEVLRELIRVDLEYGWERGRPKSLSEYQESFPLLRDDQEALSAIVYEEYRLRRHAAEPPLSAAGDFSRSGVWVDGGLGSIASTPSRAPLAEVGGGARLFCDAPHGRAATGDDRSEDRRPSGFPEVGGGFLGFRLIDEVGRGAFGRVYLATQGDLADRPVVLKVTAERYDERRRSPGSSTRTSCRFIRGTGRVRSWWSACRSWARPPSATSSGT